MENNITELARTGFVLIRGLLDGRIKGGQKAALDLAEALHNLPDTGNSFAYELTAQQLREFATKYPHLGDLLTGLTNDLFYN
ncbi:hypothetical protein L9S41_17085 [Geoalkalibacter halelectricus]|uniref:Uncharacterized protein n=1 Tax=Geoalkalibacter halelectricus TaxID=2847045 RepID=A0ABY5ZNF5_9BACT|nr:hypothetical protein [Geoalkalibacter halelectricus]UWZ79375.1 hypothetical protein L9S41_17085 [Geoalkalibacter halelectricus]